MSSGTASTARTRTVRLVRIAATEDVVQKGDATDVHLPSPSYWPIVLSFGFPWIAWGLIFSLWMALFGALCVIAALYGWVMEPSTDPAAGHHDDHEPTDAGPDGDEAEAPSAADHTESGAAAEHEEAALVD
jgi:cytochrome c oxidase subunit I